MYIFRVRLQRNKLGICYLTLIPLQIRFSLQLKSCCLHFYSIIIYYQIRILHLMQHFVARPTYGQFEFNYQFVLQVLELFGYFLLILEMYFHAHFTFSNDL